MPRIRSGSNPAPILPGGAATGGGGRRPAGAVAGTRSLPFAGPGSMVSHTPIPVRLELGGGRVATLPDRDGTALRAGRPPHWSG